MYICIQPLSRPLTPSWPRNVLRIVVEIWVDISVIKHLFTNSFNTKSKVSTNICTAPEIQILKKPHDLSRRFEFWFCFRFWLFISVWALFCECLFYNSSHSLSLSLVAMFVSVSLPVTCSYLMPSSRNNQQGLQQIIIYSKQYSDLIKHITIRMYWAPWKRDFSWGGMHTPPNCT